MRVYALYERSQKVLALYIVVAVVIVAVGCVSLTSTGNQCPASFSTADLVIYSGQYWVEKKKNLGMCKYA